MKKNIIFVTATRADFGKIKSLIQVVKIIKKFNCNIVVTGMHLIPAFGNTYKEVDKIFKKNVFKFKNQKDGDSLTEILNNTIKNFTTTVKKIKPDLIIIHGDRVETLACAIVGAMNHILTAHIEGGELSGTIDDSIRHAVTKLSHVHFVGSNNAKKIVLGMGEKKNTVYNIGSPDLDSILNKKLPKIIDVKKRYEIPFNTYGILIWHPVTSEINMLKKNTQNLLKFLVKTEENMIIINPNNDPGYNKILDVFKRYKKKKEFKFFPSIRFENFIVLLKNARFIIGNSSAGIYEAPLVNTPSVDIGTRQKKRLSSKAIKNFSITKLNLKNFYSFIRNYKRDKAKYYGKGDSAKRFLKVINSPIFWKISTQKYFYKKNDNY